MSFESPWVIKFLKYMNQLDAIDISVLCKLDSN